MKTSQRLKIRNVLGLAWIALVLCPAFVSADSLRSLEARPNDGRDDSAAFQKLLTAGGKIDVGPGVWDFYETVTVKISNDIQVKADGAIFKSHGIDGDLFRFVSNKKTPDNTTLSWHGGRFDISDQKNSRVIPYVDQGAPVKDVGTRNTADALSINGAYKNKSTGQSTIKLRHVSIRDVEIIANSTDADWQTSGGDSGIFLVADSAEITSSYFRGLRDVAIYLSADGLFNGLGGNYVVDNVKIEKSVKGVSVQRGASNVSIRNSTFYDTPIAIIVDGTDDDSKKDVISKNIDISGNFIQGSWLGVRLSDVRGASIADNTITDMKTFPFVRRIPPEEIYIWDDSQVSDVNASDNSRQKGAPLADVIID